MHFNLSRLAVAAMVWSIIDNLIKLSRPNIDQDRQILVREIFILGAIVIALVLYNR
jgi:hypothetical protein